MELKVAFSLLTLNLIVGAWGHSEYRGKCPDLKAMKSFDWEKVSQLRQAGIFCRSKFSALTSSLARDVGMPWKSLTRVQSA